ncbi:MAG: tetratricopeptide repeat protein [Nitrospirae bacterium]|nr:tetratricopeptide repeat protein [Nitrospirota bacterium]
MKRTDCAEQPDILGKWTLANNSLVHIACVVFLILIIFGNTLNAPFQWDENDFIANNPIVKDLHYFASPSEASGLDNYSAFIIRYAGYLTFALNYKIHGLSVSGFHIVNIAIHIMNSLLVYCLVLLTFRTPYMTATSLQEHSKYIAFLSSAIFAVHPLQTEAVTYVFQRLASLTAFFYLISLTAYIKSRLYQDRKRRIFFYTIALMSAILDMKTKENAFTLPLVITLYEFCFFSRSTHDSSPVSRYYYLVPILLTLAIIPATLMSLTGSSNLEPGAYGSKVYSRWDYFFTQFRVLVTYLRLLFFPVNQNIDYDYPVYKSFFDLPVLMSFAFLTALFAFGVYLIVRKKNSNGCSEPAHSFADSPALRLLGFGILWFFITLSVESSIIPVLMLIDEYRMYLPSVGLIISVVSAVFLLYEQIDIKPVFILAPFVLAITALSVATYFRNELWNDKISLWEDTVRKSPSKARAHCNLAIAYNEHNMFEKAVEQYQIAIDLIPDFAAMAYNGLGNAYLSLNMPGRAEKELLTATRLDPCYAEAHYNLGVAYSALNMPNKAIEHYLTAIKLKPGYVLAHNNLGIVYGALNMPDKAMEQFLIAINLNSGYAEAHYNLGVAYSSFNSPDKAMEQYQIAVALKPGFAEAHNNLGLIYQNMNLLDKAEQELLTAVRLKPAYVEALCNLGYTYYKMGQKENASRELNEALKINPNNQTAQQLLKEISR